MYDKECPCGILLGLESGLSRLAYMVVGGFNVLCYQSSQRTCHLFTQVPFRFDETESLFLASWLCGGLMAMNWHRVYPVTAKN